MEEITAKEKRRQEMLEGLQTRRVNLEVVQVWQGERGGSCSSSVCRDPNADIIGKFIWLETQAMMEKKGKKKD